MQIDLKNRPGQSIPPPSDDFDDASAENIGRLVARGKLLLAEKKSQIDGIIKRLLSQPKAKRTALLRSARR